MNRPDERDEAVRWLLSSAVALWVPATKEIVCQPCWAKARVKPIQFWPLMDAIVDVLAAQDESFHACDWCGTVLGAKPQGESHVH